MYELRISGQLPVDEVACEILNQVSSSRMADDVVRCLAPRYTREQVLAALNGVFCETARILKARDIATRALADLERSEKPPSPLRVYVPTSPPRDSILS